MIYIDPHRVLNHPPFPEAAAVEVLDWMTLNIHDYMTSDLEDLAIKQSMYVLETLILDFHKLQSDARSHLDVEPDNPEDLM